MLPASHTSPRVTQGDPPKDCTAPPGESAARRRVFVVRDFQLAEVEITLGGLEKRPPTGWDVEVPGFKVFSRQVWEGVVRPGIDAADYILALVDLPNGNVGWEIGYALGRPGETIALVCARDRHPEWQKVAPYRGHLVPREVTESTLRELIGPVRDSVRARCTFGRPTRRSSLRQHPRQQAVEVMHARLLAR